MEIFDLPEDYTPDTVNDTASWADPSAQTSSSDAQTKKMGKKEEIHLEKSMPKRLFFFPTIC